MQIKNFKILKAPNAIEIEWDERILELHNDFHFLGFYFDVEDSSLDLHWKERAWPGIKSIEMTFQKVSFLDIKPRNSEIPKLEDTCLSHLSKVSPTEKEYRHRGQWKDEPFHLLFKFQGGQSIEIGGESVEIRHQTFPLDLTKLSFEEWIRFIFDHPVCEPKWHYSDEWDWLSDEIFLLSYATRLFSQPEFLLNSYTVEQLEQGFSFLTSNLKDCLWNKDIPWQLREECIGSMFDLTERLFAKNPIISTCHMWWDWLRYFGDKADERVNDAMLITLSKVLTIDSEDCWGSALHGLGHLQHEGKEAVINKFLMEHTDLNEQLREYALAAIEDRVL